MRSKSSALTLAPYLVALMIASSNGAQAQTGLMAAAPLPEAAKPAAVTLDQPEPSPLSLYGHPSRTNGTPLSSPALDKYLRGANAPSGNLDHWYGNGYCW